jgi:hypothetical protein
MRQQLFGDRRRRDAENRLIEILTEMETRLAQASTKSAKAARDGKHVSQARTAVLDALANGLNGLLAWHGEQQSAAALEGRGNTPSVAVAEHARAAAAEVSPMFDTTCARTDGLLDCADVVVAIGHLAGADGDAFYASVLCGFAAALGTVYAQLLADPPTAEAAGALESTWEELRAEMLALATQAVPSRAPAAAAHDTSHDTSPRVRAAAPVALPFAPAPVTADGVADRILRFALDEPDAETGWDGAAEPEEPAAEAPPEPAPRRVKRYVAYGGPATRFGRIELVRL